MDSRTEQEVFWAEETNAKDYIQRNSNFNIALGVQAWNTILKNTNGIRSILECGCNIGGNIIFLNETLPDASKSIIEISRPAYEFVTKQYKLDRQFNGSILESNFETDSFDLVFTMGVLIHIHPDNLLINMQKMFDYSRKYILMGEYFNKTPVMIDYRGEKDKLFKRDFGKLFIENHKVKLVDYGFLWSYSTGFDDITWWLFEKE